MPFLARPKDRIFGLGIPTQFLQLLPDRIRQLNGAGFPALAKYRDLPTFAGDVYATIKVSQQRRGLSLDENDLWMAATALALSATLVSRDSDFRGIEGLSVVAP